MFEDVRTHRSKVKMNGKKFDHVFLATENLSTPFFKKDYIMVILDFLLYSIILQKNTYKAISLSKGIWKLLPN